MVSEQKEKDDGIDHILDLWFVSARSPKEKREPISDQPLRYTLNNAC